MRRCSIIRIASCRQRLSIWTPAMREIPATHRALRSAVAKAGPWITRLPSVDSLTGCREWIAGEFRELPTMALRSTAGFTCRRPIRATTSTTFTSAWILRSVRRHDQVEGGKEQDNRGSENLSRSERATEYGG